MADGGGEHQQHHREGEVHSDIAIGRGEDVGENHHLQMHQHRDQLPGGDPIGPEPVAGEGDAPQRGKHDKIDQQDAGFQPVPRGDRDKGCRDRSDDQDDAAYAFGPTAQQDDQPEACRVGENVQLVPLSYAARSAASDRVSGPVFSSGGSVDGPTAKAARPAWRWAL